MPDPRDTAAMLLIGKKPSDEEPAAPPAEGADEGESVDEFAIAADEVATALGGAPSPAFADALKHAIEICVSKRSDEDGY